MENSSEEPNIITSLNDKVLEEYLGQEVYLPLAIEDTVSSVGYERATIIARIREEHWLLNARGIGFFVLEQIGDRWKAHKPDILRD